MNILNLVPPKLPVDTGSFVNRLDYILFQLNNGQPSQKYKDEKIEITFYPSTKTNLITEYTIFIKKSGLTVFYVRLYDLELEIEILRPGKWIDYIFHLYDRAKEVERSHYSLHFAELTSEEDIDFILEDK